MQTNGKPAQNLFVNGFTVKVDTPAMYCIRIVGELDKSWSEHLGGLKITSSDQGNGQTITTLSGILPNQAALFGVMKTLYDLRLPLLSVLASCSATEPTSVPMPTASPYAPTIGTTEATQCDSQINTDLINHGSTVSSVKNPELR